MLAALMLWLPAEAQLHRGGRTIVRGGMFVKPDSLRHKSDSLANNALTCLLYTSPSPRDRG